MRREYKFGGVLLIIAFIAFSFISCERFDNTFEAESVDNSFVLHIDKFVEDLPEALKNWEPEVILSYYSDDYLNDGWDKNEIESYFSSLAQTVSDGLTVEIVSVDKSGLSFSYRIKDDTGEIDTLIVEFSAPKSEDYLFIGNQRTAEEPDYSRVLVELFTATWCSGCPMVDAAVYQLKQELGDKFIYIKYHFDPQLGFNNMNLDVINYYQLPMSLPVGIISGKYKISGSTNSYEQYKFAIDQNLNQEAEFKIADFGYSVTESVFSFSVDLTNSNSLPADLELRYVLMDKVTDVLNYSGEVSRNAVITKGATALDANSFESSVSGELTLPDYVFNQPALVVWFQTVNRPYNSETSLVHNVNEFSVVIP